MTTITARVIADSTHKDGNCRLTSLVLRYPRCIHSEFMTHRVFSRNASSSRAIPVERLIKDVIDDPYIPIHWGKNRKGMQADEECHEGVVLSPGNIVKAKEAWLVSRDFAVDTALAFSKAGYHKQIVNRLLEPWAHINVIVTATQWSNFLALRDHLDAMPEIRELAKAIRKALEESVPRKRGFGEWHLPFVDEDVIPEIGVRLSTARCARVSYKTHDGKHPTLNEDLDLYDRLVSAKPLHASPAEHQASPDEMVTGKWANPRSHGNLTGWVQHRKFLHGECL